MRLQSLTLFISHCTLHSLGKLHDAKALHAAQKGRSLTGKFLQNEAQRARTGYFIVPPTFEV